jgi:uncharacterized protein YbjT (DUF2867 family)
MDTKNILVFGATGQQGGAVANALLADGHHVIGLTRNPDSEKAKALQQQGVDMRKGSAYDKQYLVELMKEVSVVFAITTPFEEGMEKETAQGISIAEAAKEAGVAHFIFTSVASANQNTGIPHFDSKFLVEQRIAQLGLPYTIIGPVYFMSNLFFPWNLEDLKQGLIKIAIPDTLSLQQIDVDDIGKMVAVMVKRPADFIGKRFDIATDELTGPEMAEILSKVTGKPFTFQGFSPDYLRESSEDLAIMFEWFDQVGFSIDIEALRRVFPDTAFTSFEDYAKKQEWRFLSD